METLYYNGTIRTMVSHIPEEALLVRDGRVAAVGDFGPLLETHPYVQKVDLQGACLMPAFLDAHSHIVSWAMGKLQADLSGAENYPAMAAAMADFARRKQVPRGQWVIGRGADRLLDEGLAAELDLSGLSAGLSDWTEQVEQRQSELEAAQSDALAAGIAERTAAYISDKGAALGLAVTARVEPENSPDGIPVPSAVELTGPRSAELSAYIAEELGIPPERQIWKEQDDET